MAKKQTNEVNKTKVNRANKKHFVLFNNGGVISATTPKDWARANQILFDRYDFSDSDHTPIVDVIERKLSNMGFSEISNNEIVIYYQYSSI